MSIFGILNLTGAENAWLRGCAFHTDRKPDLGNASVGT